MDSDKDFLKEVENRHKQHKKKRFKLGDGILFGDARVLLKEYFKED